MSPPITGLTANSSGDLVTAGYEILSRLLPLAGGIALAFVIYGGVLLIISQGNADKVTQARRTITNGLIGVFIVVLSYVIVLTINSVLVNNIIK